MRQGMFGRRHHCRACGKVCLDGDTTVEHAARYVWTETPLSSMQQGMFGRRHHCRACGKVCLDGGTTVEHAARYVSFTVWDFPLKKIRFDIFLVTNCFFWGGGIKINPVVPSLCIGRPLETMSDARQKCGSLRYATTNNMIWANQKSESFEYHWLHALVRFDVTSFPAILLGIRHHFKFCQCLLACMVVKPSNWSVDL